MKTPMLPFPAIFVRSRPGKILGNFSKRSGIRFIRKRFRDPVKAERELDALLDRGQPAGVQVDFFFMDFFPSWHRVHINVHFLNVIGREGDHYLVSDSYYPTIARVSREAMRKGRFAGGSMAPRGFMFYPADVPRSFDIPRSIRKGMQDTVFSMLKIPLPFLGVRGIRRFAGKITDWPEYARDNDQLAHEIFRINILLEDQGTGGGGFRFIYASFLREASGILDKPILLLYSKRMMAIGDEWRNVSLFASRIAKNRDLGIERLAEMGRLIRANADLEYSFFTDLKKVISNLS